MSDLDLRYVVILGDPWGDSGVTFHGPFGSQEQAHEWGCHDDGGKGGPFSVRTLNRPSPLANRGKVLFVAKHDYRKGDTMRLRLENGVWHELPPDKV